jgi:hypothetical protein
MQQTQSIIVYRNPMEQQLWEGAGNNPGIILYVLAMMFVSVFVIWLCHGPILQTVNRRYFKNQNRSIRMKKPSNGVGAMWFLSLIVIAIVGYNLRFLLD